MVEVVAWPDNIAFVPPPGKKVLQVSTPSTFRQANSMYLNSCGTRKATAEEVNMVIAIEPVHAAIMAPAHSSPSIAVTA